jgi:hypothetical protein
MLSPLARRGCTQSFGKMRRAFILIVLLIGIGLATRLIRPSPGRFPESDDWLQIVGGPTLAPSKGGASYEREAIVFTISNASPRALRLSVQELGWVAQQTGGHGTWDGMGPSPALLPIGGTFDLCTWSGAKMPPPSDIDYWVEIHWWEEPSPTRRFSEGLENWLGFGIWPRRALASGMLKRYVGEAGYERIMLSRYGIILGRVAEPDGPANRSQPIRAETNRTSVAAGSDC